MGNKTDYMPSPMLSQEESVADLDMVMKRMLRLHTSLYSEKLGLLFCLFPLKIEMPSVAGSFALPQHLFRLRLT